MAPVSFRIFDRSLPLLLTLALTVMVGCDRDSGPAQDEAKAAGLGPEDFPQATADYFHEMDGGIELTEEEVMGRNTWMIWTAGNQAFWDYIANNSFGALDLLKIVSSYPYESGDRIHYSRDNRFEYFGLINEPGFEKATEPGEYGLWLDQRVAEPEPFDEEIYGRASGVVGLRLFPNPDFDEEARENWDPERYYTDRSYYYGEIERPYRVGMTCAFCHVGPNPVNPPPDPENPEWEHLSTNVGAQYFWAGRIFGYELDRDNFLWQLFNSWPPGTVETSMVATDNINNTRTMNAIYDVGARLAVAEEEEIGPQSLAIPGTQPSMPVPHILKDGADAIGILGALSRVYLNIGEYHQEWIRHFRPLIGGRPQTPISIEVARENSTYWLATEDRVENLAAFFLKAAGPHHLEDAPGGEAYLTDDADQLRRGKIVFAEECASCHSGKQPESLEPGTEEYLEWMRTEVLKPDFRENNYLATDDRHPVTEIGTNACAAVASNAIEGHIWDNFSSETYKNLPAVGTIEVSNQIGDSVYAFDWEAPGGGRGYYRVPSLISMWSTAPYMHDNQLGLFNSDPSVEGRMEAFNDGVEKLLWPERRADTRCAERWGLPFCPPINRTTEESWIVINEEFLPKILRPLLGWKRFIGMADDEVRIGPIPAGTPVGLLANLNLQIEAGRLPELVDLAVRVKKDLRRIERENLSEAEAAALLQELVPGLLEMSKCPDLVVDRGHTYGADLSDEDKWALIEFLKTL